MTVGVTAPHGHPVVVDPPRRRRWPWVVLAVLVVFVAGVGLGLWALRRKDIRADWAACGVGNREVRSISIDEGGRIWIAANEMGRGDVFFSDDRCASFTPVGLQTEVVWSVSWLPRAHALCAGTREGLRCLVGGAMRELVAASEIYFARETREGVVAGGWPTLWFGKGDLSQFAPVAPLSRAASDAVVTDWATIVAGGPGILASLDGGHTFAPVPSADFAPRALASLGSRVWAAGGSFGGFMRRSDDGGQTWTAIEAPGSQPETLVVLPGRPNAALLGTHGDLRPGDAYVTQDAGGSWRALGCPGAEIHALAVDEESIYCGATSLSGTKGMWRMPIGALELAPSGNAI